MMSSSLFQSTSDFNPIPIMDSYHDNHVVTLHHGDSKSFLPTIPDGAISLVVTSPPYNIGKSYERKQDIAAYLAEQEVVICELVRILVDTGSICWQTGNFVDEGEVFPLDVSSILENYILRDRIKDNLLETHWARTHQIYGNFSTKNGKPVFGTSPMSKRII